MQLTETTIIHPNSLDYRECERLCFLSKNLYNTATYLVRQELFATGDNISANLHHRLKESLDYRALPAKVASSILNSVGFNFKSYFAAKKSWNLNPSKFNGKPKLPNYLNKVDGRYFASFTNQAISRMAFKKEHVVKLSLTSLSVGTRISSFSLIDCVRVVPHNSYYSIEVVYTVPDVELLADNDRVAAIDLGINNLATVTTNTGRVPFIINGKPLKSINQFYNKNKAHYQSQLEKKNNTKKSKRLNCLTLKRKNKVDNYLHKASKIIVDKLKEENITTLVVGKNKDWKQDVSIGKKNNQNFVQIPHSRFIQMLEYKCELVGIKTILREESYTSKCSFLDSEPIRKHEHYVGKRIKRGLFKSSTGRLINADVNGSYNIMLKAIPKAFDAEGIEGVGVHPVIIAIAK